MTNVKCEKCGEVLYIQTTESAIPADNVEMFPIGMICPKCGEFNTPKLSK